MLTRTQKEFKTHEKFLRAVLNIDLIQYNKVKNIIVTYMGPFDENKTYCGPGKVGDLLVPDLCFKFAGYAHDGLVAYLEATPEPLRVIDKEFADDLFRAVMLGICDQCPVSGVFICDNVLPEMYYNAVRVFGSYDYDPENITKRLRD